MRRHWTFASTCLCVWGMTACYEGAPDGADTDGAGGSDGGGAMDDNGGPGDGEPPPGGVEELTCDPASEDVAPARVWRLTGREYDAAVEDVLGDTSHPAADFVLAPVSEYGFSNVSDDLRVGDVEAFDYQRAAESVASSTASLRLATVFACGEAQLGDATCIEDFINTTGRRLFRRPLGAAEVTKYADLYDVGAQSLGDRGGVQAVLEGMLQSPFFLYKTELGNGQPDDRGWVRLERYELATALSFTLLGHPPDDALLLAAEDGRLDSLEGIEDEARRLLEMPGAALGVGEFYRQLFGFDEMRNVDKDETLFPDYALLQASMEAEFDLFVEHLLTEDDATWSTLLTADYTFLDERLAELYGVPLSGPWSQASVSDAGRAGVLTMPGSMAAFAGSREASIAKRGTMIRRRLLCQAIPDPAPEVFDDLPPVDEGDSLRAYLEEVTAPDGCQACHSLINGPGFAFDAFDAVGAHADVEGRAFDPSGEIIGTRDMDGPIDGPRALAEKLAQSEQAGECFAIEQFRFSLGREVSSADACSIRAAYDAFAASDGDLLELAVATVTSNAFLYRRQP